MKIKTCVPFILLLSGGLFFSMMEIPQGKPWPVPEKFQNMKNPVPSDKESLSIGKSLYNRHCKSCHGNEGYGDGPKAAQLDTPSGDFTAESFQAQTDGAIFYKTKEGREDMPTFDKKITNEEDIWCVVNYVRTLKG